jgi:hypothetical protein
VSLLPGQILPPGQPIGTVNADGTVTIEQNWWLLIFNIVLNSIGASGSFPDEALELLQSSDDDVVNSDAMVLRRHIQNALVQAIQPSDVVTGIDDLPDLQRALLLAQDGLLQDPQPRAQPAQSVAVGTSPFTYTAAFSGTLSITGGAVSALSLIRQGTLIALGITSGLIPLSRLDLLQITYSAAPTVTFLPQ